MYNSAGAVTISAASAKTFSYTVTIEEFRPASEQDYTFTVTYSAGKGSFTSVRLQEHSPEMSGTFTLTLGGVPVQLQNSTTN